MLASTHWTTRDCEIIDRSALAAGSNGGGYAADVAPVDRAAGCQGEDITG